MGRRKGSKVVVAALAGAAGVLAWLDFHLLQSLVDVSPIAPPPGKTEVRPQRSPPPATALDKKAPEQFQEAVDRPLFNPGRRPVQRSQTATRAPKMAPVRLRLVGVMKPDDGPPRALIRFADEPAGRWVAEGEEYHGWTLTKVNEGSVTVEAGGRTEELMLFIPPPAPKVAPAPAPQAPKVGPAPQAPQQSADPEADAARQP
jgi:hypothetical protein